MEKLFMVQIKSDKIIEQGKKALIIPMSIEDKGYTKEELAKMLYPDLVDGHSFITITPMTTREYNKYRQDGIYRQKRMVVRGKK
mgnify:CR=1 FL=1